MLLTAHSGSDNTLENSLSFVEKMLERNIQSIEVDVRRSKKGQLYLSHDRVDSWRDAKNIFMLEELFQYLADRQRQTRINCDLKEPGLEAEVKWTAKKWEVYDQVVFSGDVNPAHLETWDRQKIYFNIENCLPNIYKVDSLKKSHFDVLMYFCKKYGLKTINLQYAFCSDEWIEWCFEEDIQLSVWTVNNFEEIEQFNQKGIYNVTSRSALNYLSCQSDYERIVT